jgi:hypothetical protein
MNDEPVKQPTIEEMVRQELVNLRHVINTRCDELEKRIFAARADVAIRTEIAEIRAEITEGHNMITDQIFDTERKLLKRMAKLRRFADLEKRIARLEKR